MQEFTFDFSIITGPDTSEEFRFDAQFANLEDAQAIWTRLLAHLPAEQVAGTVYPKSAQLDLEALFARDPRDLTETEHEILLAAEEELGKDLPAHPWEGQEG